MNRLVSILMLATFALQHFACCCTGTGMHECDEFQCLTDMQHEQHFELESAIVAEHSACCHDHCGADSNLPHNDTPTNDTHEHHVCVGTHVFFVSAPRASVPPTNISQNCCFTPIDASHLSAMTSMEATRYSVASNSPLSASSRRSTLSVYRI